MKKSFALTVIVLAAFASAAFAQGGQGLRSSVTLTCNLDLCNTTNTAWTLDKCENPDGVCNGFLNRSMTASSPVSWTITAGRTGTSSAVLTVNGFVRITNSGGAGASIGNIVVNLQKPGTGGKKNNWVSHAAAVANASGTGTANICPQASSEELGSFTNSAASLTFTDASNNSVWSITPQQTIPPGGTVDLLYQAVFNSFPSGQVRVEVIVTFGNAGTRGGGSSCSNVDINGDGNVDSSGDEALVRSVPCRVTRSVPAEIHANSTVVLADREPQESAATPINGYTCSQYSSTTSPYVCADPLFPFSGVGTGGGVTYSNHSTTVGTTNGDGEQISSTETRQVSLTVDTGSNISNCVRLTGADVTVPVDTYTFTCVQGVRIRQCAWRDEDVAVGGHCSYTQGGWGAPPHGENPATKLPTHLNVSVGTGGFSMTFTSQAAIEAYLPAGGTAGALTTSVTNPTTTKTGHGPPQPSTSSGVFGGQVLTLKLNLLYADPSLGDLFVCGTGGKTVSDVLADAELALGSGTLPSYVTSISQLSGIVDNINNSYDNCRGASSVIAALYCTQ